MEDSAKEYIDSENSTNLINYMQHLVEPLLSIWAKKITDCL